MICTKYMCEYSMKKGIFVPFMCHNPKPAEEDRRHFLLPQVSFLPAFNLLVIVSVMSVETGSLLASLNRLLVVFSNTLISLAFNSLLGFFHTEMVNLAFKSLFLMAIPHSCR